MLTSKCARPGTWPLPSTVDAGVDGGDARPEAGVLGDVGKRLVGDRRPAAPWSAAKKTASDSSGDRSSTGAISPSTTRASSRPVVEVDEAGLADRTGVGLLDRDQALLRVLQRRDVPLDLRAQGAWRLVEAAKAGSAASCRSEPTARSKNSDSSTDELSDAVDEALVEVFCRARGLAHGDIEQRTGRRREHEAEHERDDAPRGTGHVRLPCAARGGVR